MGHVLTYHNLTSGEDWFEANKYDDKEINAIVDPQGGNLLEAPTSIPSPFAHFDLVKNAFRNVIGKNSIDGTLIDKKLVSEALDVGELFFNVYAHSKSVKVIRWDKNADLDRLLKSPSKAHRRLGHAIKLFLDQDAEAYNFDKLEALYFIQFDNDPDKIVGGTSPSSLFFASANPHPYAQITMPNGDVLFDLSTKHLYERDEAFILYMYALRQAILDFGTRFRELNDYLDYTKTLHFDKDPKYKDLVGKINALNRSSYDEYYSPITLSGTHIFAEILGVTLRTRKDKVMSSSDYEIASGKLFNQKEKPLVLQNGHGGKSRHGEEMIYFTHPYPQGLEVPYFAPEAIEERHLPGLQHIKYPYLVIGDFLEQYLIELYFPINGKKYFDGHLEEDSSTYGEEAKGFILPLKKAIFDYFTPEEIMGKVSDGKPMFQLERLARDAGVKATLRIPIKKAGEYIQFERRYYMSTSRSVPTQPQAGSNDGAIFESPVSLSVFPFIATGKFDDKRHYRVLLVDLDEIPSREYSLSFIRSDKNAFVAERATVDKTKAGDRECTKVYILESEFDAIEVDTRTTKGLLIPKMETAGRGSEEFHFALDFGTTNTHIEYKIGANGTPRPFDISEDDLQVGTLHPLKGMREFLVPKQAMELSRVPNEIFPELIGKDELLRFPQRTVLAERENLNFDKTVYTLADFYIPFIYGKRNTRENARLSTNLKWANTLENEANLKRINAFLEKLIFMIRAKVVLNHGNLNKTHLMWFYPSSMATGRLNDLKLLWDRLFKEYISGDSGNISILPESIAPFYYYKNHKNIPSATRPVVAIDIGGETSDVVIYHKSQPVELTSFRFAANSIFGDGYSSKYGAANRNGFVMRYYDKILNLLSQNNLTDLESVAEKIRKSNKSIELVALFFSLENHQEVIEKNAPISFTEIARRDNQMRVIYLLFFTAIIYHVAQMMKARHDDQGKALHLDKPRYVTFSGNGSRVLFYISPDEKLLGDLTKVIFEKVYGRSEEDFDLDLYRETLEPKEATCRGGLMMEDTFSPQEIKDKTVSYLGLRAHPFSGKDTLYGKLGPGEKKEILDQYLAFVRFFLELGHEFDFHKNFTIPPRSMELAEELLTKDAMDFLEEGLSRRKEELPGFDQAKMEETLFFFPLIGSLNRLAFEIANDQV